MDSVTFVFLVVVILRYGGCFYFRLCWRLSNQGKSQLLDISVLSLSYRALQTVCTEYRALSISIAVDNAWFCSGFLGRLALTLIAGATAGHENVGASLRSAAL